VPTAATKSAYPPSAARFRARRDRHGLSPAAVIFHDIQLSDKIEIIVQGRYQDLKEAKALLD